MYEAFFQLAERPFAAAPCADRYFPAGSIEQARQSLRRAIERAEGTGFITGPSGTGKTLLLQTLSQEFNGRFASVLLSSGRLNTARALLQAILYELNLPYRQMDESELRLSLIDHVSQNKIAVEGLLLLIDEAHNLPWRLLEEVRMMTNWTRDGEPRVRVVLAGNPRLEERFASPRLDSFSQRLAVRSYLESLSRHETMAYVQAQIRRVGGNAEKTFAEDALVAVHRATDGIPRLINQVCDHALLLASLGGVKPLTSAAIDEAWADLQQLPAPWNTAQSMKPASTRVIEFAGPEDAAPDDLPEAIPFPVANSTNAKSSVVEFGALESAEHQLDRLESHLEELEEDFQPAGMIHPEVELIFQGGRNPFGEEFVEEEVVLDRYASLEASVFDRRPMVACSEGRELSALLAPHACQPAEAIVTMTTLKSSTATSAPAAKSKPTAPFAEEFSTRTVSEPAAIQADDDEDLIVVEDDPRVVHKVVPPPLVRKQEYRQLFAKLRRG